tara:strand:+ start:1687 stop:1791 length:105 start_codon:yes stop_codon:yes gene_type:complete
MNKDLFFVILLFILIIILALIVANVDAIFPTPVP